MAFLLPPKLAKACFADKRSGSHRAYARARRPARHPGLGALLRGPLVGLTEEELLDIIWALPRSEDDPERLPRLDLGVEASDIAHPLARSTIEKLQALYRQTNSTTPHDLMSQAVDALRVRPLLLERHRRQAERALANVDLYLSLTTSFSVRGLRAFAETMTAAWTDEARAVEGVRTPRKKLSHSTPCTRPKALNGRSWCLSIR